MDSLDNVRIVGKTDSFGVGGMDMVLVKLAVSERPPSDDGILFIIILVSIASVVGVGIAITFFVWKHRK